MVQLFGIGAVMLMLATVVVDVNAVVSVKTGFVVVERGVVCADRSVVGVAPVFLPC